MPKIRCKCDYIIRLNDIPSQDQYMIISDVEYDQFEDQVDTEKLYLSMKVVAKCPNCGRLHVFWDGFDKPQSIYKLEE